MREQTLLRTAQASAVAFLFLLVLIIVPPVTNLVWGSAAAMLGYVLLLLACVLVLVGALVLLNR